MNQINKKGRMEWLADPNMKQDEETTERAATTSP
jgi:hypothetical protein